MTKIQELFQRQQKNRWVVAQSSCVERIEKLRRLKKLIQERRGALAEAVAKDFSKPQFEVEATETTRCIDEINHTISHLKKWMSRQPVRTPLVLAGTSSHLRYEPKGQVLILAPWNYPFNLALAPVVAAVSAGNVVILKPSEKTPTTSKFIAQLIKDWMKEDEVAVVEGGIEVSEALLKLPFDHIFFTGSPAVGKIVMKAAAENLASVTLELGGKSPAFVTDHVNIKDVASSLVWGKFVNAGQTCVAPDYILCHRSVTPELVAEMKVRLQQFYGTSEEARQKTPDYCRIVDAQAWVRQQRLLQDAVGEGAKILFGGRMDSEERYFEPTLLSNVSHDSTLMQEEIFGPILPILEYDNLDQAIQFVQKRDKPLSLYIFSSNSNLTERILSETSSGGTVINNTLIHLANSHLPLGGVGASGMGSYHGLFGFKTFSHERAILVQGRLNMVKNFFPPYNRKMIGHLQSLLRWLE